MDDRQKELPSPSGLVRVEACALRLQPAELRVHCEEESPRVVGARPRGERRKDHLRRYIFRGMDELRRQQHAPPAPAAGGDLDVSV